MKSGTNYKFGDIVLIVVPFVDTSESKLRPALILFEEFDNVIVVGTTSNLSSKGIPLGQPEGLLIDSIIKLNYIFTISINKIIKTITHLPESKKLEICNELKLKFLDC